MLLRYTCLHLPLTTPLHPSPPPSLASTPPWFCSCILYSCSWKPFPSFPPLSPPTSPLVTVTSFLISMLYSGYSLNSTLQFGSAIAPSYSVKHIVLTLLWRYLADMNNIYNQLTLSKGNLPLIIWVSIIQKVEGLKNKNRDFPELKEFCFKTVTWKSCLSSQVSKLLACPMNCRLAGLTIE